MIIRLATRDDVALIVDSWWHVARTQTVDSWYRDAPAGAVGYILDRRVRDALEASELRVACSDDDPRVVLGWICTDVDGDCVHMVYTKSGAGARLRRLGIARALVSYAAPDATRYSTRTYASERMRVRGGWPAGREYDPHALWRRDVDR